MEAGILFQLFSLKKFGLISCLISGYYKTTKPFSLVVVV